jgi:hypothetical protein
MVAGSISNEVTGFFNWPSPSSSTVVLGSTQSLTKMRTRNIPGGKGRPAREADNFTVIYESAVRRMWEPRRLRTLWTSTACFSESFTFLRWHLNQGRAIAQAVSRRLPARVRPCGICGCQRGTRVGFLRVLRFSMSICIPRISPQSSCVIWDWYNGPNSGRSTKWTQSHPIRKKKDIWTKDSPNTK